MSCTMVSDQDTLNPDLESNSDDHAFLMNETVNTFAWKGVTVTVKDRQTKEKKSILSNASGHANQGTNHYHNTVMRDRI